MEIIGWVGSLCLAVCALPQAIKVHKDKNADGISHIMIWLWLIGEIFTIFYVCLYKFYLPLVINYGLNIVFVSVIFYYKYLYKKIV